MVSTFNPNTWETASGEPRSHYVAENGLECLILLPLYPCARIIDMCPYAWPNSSNIVHRSETWVSLPRCPLK